MPVYVDKTKGLAQLLRFLRYEDKKIRTQYGEKFEKVVSYPLLDERDTVLTPNNLQYLYRHTDNVVLQNDCFREYPRLSKYRPGVTAAPGVLGTFLYNSPANDAMFGKRVCAYMYTRHVNFVYLAAYTARVVTCQKYEGQYVTIKIFSF